MIDINNKSKIDIMDKRVSIIGLGKSGTEAAKLANHLGAKVFGSDLKSDKKINFNSMELMENHIPSETGIHTDKIYEADLWVISPGIPKNSGIIQKANKYKIPIVGEIEFASWFAKYPIVAVTGSNGKTTSTHILSAMCQTENFNGIMGGNMGTPFSKIVLNDLKRPNEKRIYILEISSFQMEFIVHFSPFIAVYTNISPDHLDRHKTMKEYLKMKMEMVKNLNSSGYIVYNYDDMTLKKIFQNEYKNTIPFSIKKKNTLFYIKDYKIHNQDKTTLNIDKLDISGDHNISNLLAAATASHMLGVSNEEIFKIMATFKGVEHRLEFVAEINQVKFINDSKATNIESVIVAIKSFSKPIILILGGLNKGADFRLLLPHIKSSHVRDIVSFGDAGGQINTALGDAVRSVKVTDLSSAVKIAHSMAAPGDIILLSPGCASFDAFEDFEERGKHFKQIIKNLETK